MEPISPRARSQPEHSMTPYRVPGCPHAGPPRDEPNLALAVLLLALMMVTALLAHASSRESPAWDGLVHALFGG